MRTKIELVLSVDGKAKKFTREGLSVRETLKFREFLIERVEKENELAEKYDGEFDLKARIEIENNALMDKSEYVAGLFDEVTQDMILDGLGPDKVNKELDRILSIIDPIILGEVEDEGK